MRMNLLPTISLRGVVQVVRVVRSGELWKAALDHEPTNQPPRVEGTGYEPAAAVASLQERYDVLHEWLEAFDIDSPSLAGWMSGCVTIFEEE